MKDYVRNLCLALRGKASYQAELDKISTTLSKTCNELEELKRVYNDELEAKKRSAERLAELEKMVREAKAGKRRKASSVTEKKKKGSNEHRTGNKAAS